ncbi:DUF2917 domain-containing protein [Geobacter sp. DSM 9736]|uniref:DUF2917 domain-containing protein n=1 Tax=Geobacter sp. DSM 9736 TaxID=1277350 RepID=UPI000B512619|nr:DUF2917 domain-containing protein [Geobacter sp. DSM 9736]SNB46252.1 Protein of unknown function [Geobacter sp. DSM 9736]
MELAKSRYLTLRDAGGCIISCRRGIVWVTQTGDPRDFFLKAPETLLVTGRGLVVVEALRDSAVEVLRGNPPPQNAL